MGEAVIKVENLSKIYRLAQTLTLRQQLGEMVGRIRKKGGMPPVGRRRDFCALQDVSFDVAPGEVLGLIGKNGAGKSTLLKILSQITDPTAGRVSLHGRVGSLLEVGTGFHPELTGRENVFLNGAILGMRRPEIKAKFDEIVDFSGVEAFLDTPVKRYSSGMYVRLAFAVAAHLESEILIVDEVLAVGDIDFQNRCMGKMKDMSSSGRTVLFVSHNMKAVVGLCSRAGWLVDGKLKQIGPTSEVVSSYVESYAPVTDWSHLHATIEQLPADPDFKLHSVQMAQDNQSVGNIANGQPFSMDFEYEVKRAVSGLRVYVDVCDEYDDVLIRSFHDENVDTPVTIKPGLYRSRITFPGNILAPREYKIAIQAGIFNVRSCIPHDAIRLSIKVSASNGINRAYPQDTLRSKVKPLVRWETSQCSITH